MDNNSRLFNRGYVSLLGTQFLGAANDNVLKQILVFMVATGIWSERLGEGGQSLPALCLTIPFILLSGFAGQLADRFSKRTVMVAVKVAEIPIAIVALVGLFTQSLWLTMAALLLLAVQSSFFGPAKYGVVPELVDEQHLSQANGLMNMFTNVAIILGSLAAGPLCMMYDPQPIVHDVVSSMGPLPPDPEPVLWAPGAALVVLAVLGLLSVLTMPRLPAADPTLKVKFQPFKTYWESIREMGAPLLTVTLAWSGFYMVGMMALLIIPEYERILQIGYTKTSLLIGTLGVTIAISSVAAGFLSGKAIRPQMIPFGATGMAVAFIMLGLFEPTFGSVTALIALAGLSAGFYIVPLQALLQKLSPPDERGRFLGTANGISFMASSIGAGLFWLLTDPIGLPANRVHLACAVLAIVGTIAGTLQLRRILAGRREPAVEE